MDDYEIWKDVKGYEGAYQVSNLGKVKSLSRLDARKHLRPEKILKSFDIGNGYFRVNLFKNGKMSQNYIHRLVAEAFIPKIEGRNIVNHLNENPSDNRALNLAWVTTKENLNYGTAVERRAKKCQKQIIRIDLHSGESILYESFNSAIEQGFSRSGIYNCCTERAKTHKGYKWKYSK